MNWLRHHYFALRDACSHLLRSPGNFLLNVLVVSIALALPFAGLTALENIRPISNQLAVEPEISLFLAMNTTREQATALAPAIREILNKNNISAALKFVPREQAFESLKNNRGLTDVLNTLGTNPLPDSYVLQLTGFQNAMDTHPVEDIAEKLKALPSVDTIQIDSAWIKRLAALLRVLQLALLLLGITLSVVVVAVVFNTIRLQVMTQYEEIAVARLLGATNAFIHRPFYYTGALLGICSGILTIAMVMAIRYPLNQAIADFAHLYASEFQLAPPSIQASIYLLIASGLLGLLGAMISVKRHLQRLP